MILVGLFVTGIELAFDMAIIGFLVFTYLVSFSAASNLLVKDFYNIFTSYGLTVIPLFVLMGQITSHSKIAGRLYRAAHTFVGHVPGGLAPGLLIAGSMVLGHFFTITEIFFMAADWLSGLSLPPWVIMSMIFLIYMIGVIIPPVAICVFIVKAISGVSESVIYKGALPFILSLFFCAAPLFIFPSIATRLPGLFMK